MKRSKQIVLVLIGAAVMSGCAQDEVRYAEYKNGEDCKADWGDTGELCVSEEIEDDDGNKVRMFYSPTYLHTQAGQVYYGYAPRPAPSRSVGYGTTYTGTIQGAVARGGFGSLAVYHGAAGG